MSVILATVSAIASVLACLLVVTMRSKIGGTGDPAATSELQLLKEKVAAHEASMKDEFARSRKEALERAQAEREELRNNLSSVEKR